MIDDYKPTLIVGIWRGGASIGVAIHELLSFMELEVNHAVIQTSSYSGPGQRSKTVNVFGVEQLAKIYRPNDRILLVDDVFDTGLSIEAVIEECARLIGEEACSQIKVVTPFFKPKRNESTRVPDYYFIETDDWIVFPHELEGIPIDQILAGKPPEIRRVFAQLLEDKKSPAISV